MESFSGEQVSMIIDARVDEMLVMIDDAVKKSGIRLGNWSNVYFTGGGLMPMGGARVYAAGKLARLGYTNIVEFGGINSWPGEIVTE